MNYLALGDSISIDDYTGVSGGGAASQFARLVGATHFQDLTRDGRTTDGVLEALLHVTVKPDVVTLTAGGNDFLQIAYQIVHPLGGGSLSWMICHANRWKTSRRSPSAWWLLPAPSSSTRSTTRPTATIRSSHLTA